ncbi:MFS transporter [uncultured Arcticibacterium sp.]|uniref:MFS transporter n=1 Tax=uncultured Arcticibacterium sp. TaxID=2173042 RepID=UPI0030FA068A
MLKAKIILPVIVLSQFCGTSLWFAGNSIMNDLVINYGFNSSALGPLTSSVQLGFIAGTLLFALLAISDRISPSKVFLVCAVLGSIFNLGILWEGNNLFSILTLRFFTGFFLAGIYPVGMKIAADHFQNGLGKSLGLLVGALVFGTAFPHLLKGIFDWESVILATSGLAFFGGLLLFFLVPDGPFRKPGQKIAFSSFKSLFGNGEFRAAAFGYFGHMWELYAYWAFIPIILTFYQSLNPSSNFNIPIISFTIIAVGGIGCIAGGFLSQHFGAKKIATLSLLISCICCLVSPFILGLNSEIILISFLLFWGLTVTADSPLFSTLVAQNAIPELKGTALTLVNCLGFSISIFSIQLLNSLKSYTDSYSIYAVLAFGPILGLLALRKQVN